MGGGVVVFDPDPDPDGDPDPDPDTDTDGDTDGDGGIRDRQGSVAQPQYAG